MHASFSCVGRTRRRSVGRRKWYLTLSASGQGVKSRVIKIISNGHNNVRLNEWRASTIATVFHFYDLFRSLLLVQIWMKMGNNKRRAPPRTFVPNLWFSILMSAFFSCVPNGRRSVANWEVVWIAADSSLRLQLKHVFRTHSLQVQVSTRMHRRSENYPIRK